MSALRADALIVGGGPAGSALACFLAARGVDTLVLEGARFPRDQICGESVSPEGWRILEAMGAAERVRALRPQPVRGMRLVSPDGTSFAGHYRSDELLGSVWEVTASAAGTITVTRPRHEAELFGWTAGNTFALRGLELSFADAVKGKSPAFTLKGGRVQGLRFERIP